MPTLELPSRRTLVAGLLATSLAAPAVVQASSLMRIKVWRPGALWMVPIDPVADGMKVRDLRVANEAFAAGDFLMVDHSGLARRVRTSELREDMLVGVTESSCLPGELVPVRFVSRIRSQLA